jgi:hypothetical protein
VKDRRQLELELPGDRRREFVVSIDTAHVRSADPKSSRNFELVVARCGRGGRGEAGGRYFVTGRRFQRIDSGDLPGGHLAAGFDAKRRRGQRRDHATGYRIRLSWSWFVFIGIGGLSGALIGPGTATSVSRAPAASLSTGRRARRTTSPPSG